MTLRMLMARVEDEVDPTTRHMAAWATHTVQVYESGDSSASSTETSRQLRAIGRLFSRVYHTSLMTALGPTVASCPASDAVLGWMVWGLVSSDPHFRVSPHSGYVCYPALPSLLNLSWGLHGTALHSQLASGLHRKVLGPSLGAYRGKDMKRTALEADSVFLGDAAHFVWQYPASSEGPAEKSGLPLGSGPSSRHNQILPWCHATALSCALVTSAAVGEGSPLPQGTPPHSEAFGPGSSGHPLVDSWVRALEATNGSQSLLPHVDSFGSYVMAAEMQKLLLQSNGARAPRRTTGVAWNEAKTGNPVFVAWAESAFSGDLSRLMDRIARHERSGTTWLDVNAHELATLMNLLGIAPIAVMRLATALRWHLTVPFAPAYSQSFLYFLLLYTANVEVTRLYAEEERQNRLASQQQALTASVDAAALTETWRRMQEQLQKTVPVSGAVPGPSTGRTQKSKYASVQSCERNQRKLLMAAQRQYEVNIKEVIRSLQAAAVAIPRSPPPTSSPPADSVTPLFLFKVLAPHEQCPSHAHTGDPCGVCTTARGVPLQRIAILNVTECTPHEVLRDVLRVFPPPSTRTSPAMHLESLSESIYCYPLRALRRRLLATAQMWLQYQADIRPLLPGADTNGTEKDPAINVRLTVAQLARITLWEHEFGEAVACEALFALLAQSDDVTLTPPAPAATTTDHAPPMWCVQLRRKFS